MRISVLTIGVIASIITTATFANTVITSQTYVDNADALKQDKITAGTTGNVVLYNGTQNGQTQFTGRAIYDGANDYDSTTDANKLITAGAVDGMVGDVYDYVDDEISNIDVPELPTGNPGYAVLYDENGDIGDEMIILPDDQYLWSGDSSYDLDGEGHGLITQRVLGYNTDLTIDLSGSGKIYPTVSGVKGWAQQWAQQKKVCTRWIDNAAHTDANCLLWNLP